MAEELVKRKRGRPRKQVESVEIPDEVTAIIKEIENKELELLKKEFQQIKLEVIKRVEDAANDPNLFKWDVCADDKIEFFDANLSYELTGYRPINDKQGLDFDPAWFTEARETFLRTGHYTSFRMGTKAFADHWTREYKRCRDGMTVNGYTITGDNYFFLNYYQLMDLDSADKAGGGRMYAFPTFYVGLYEWFHYVEMCKRLRLNAFLMKSREVG